MSKELSTIQAKIEALIQEAYHLGRSEGISDIARAAGQMSANASIRPTFPHFATTEEKDIDFRDGSTIKLVHEYVKENQGLLGIELVKDLQTAGHKIEERTIRTALHRLKKKKFLENRGGKWFLK